MPVGLYENYVLKNELEASITKRHAMDGRTTASSTIHGPAI